MATDTDARAAGREKTHKRAVSRAAPWSYAATAMSVALWIALVVVNRATSGEVRPEGDRGDLLAVVMPLWTALGLLAVLLALVALVRSRTKGVAVLALALSVFVAAVPILERL